MYPYIKQYREAVCRNCGKEFSTTKSYQLFCTVQCRKDAYDDISYGLSLPRGAIGTIGELLVCSDLLKRGFEVFRSVNWHSSCDLLITKDGQILRMEVKTARRLSNGQVTFPVSNVKKKLADHFALVVHEANGNHTVQYVPDLTF